MKRVMMLVLGAALAAGACAQEPMTYRDLERLAARDQRDAVSRPEPDTCRMGEFQSLIGTDGAAIDTSRLPEGARVICHNCPVTLDYRSTRLNIELGPDGKVASLRCG